MSSSNRQFAVLVWGATGFTGRLVAEYLTHNYPNIPVALGGRSRSKLQAVASALGKADTSILTADAADADSLDRIVSQAQVVISTVGPFSVHGLPLVASCVRCKTDYIDSTGEPDFVRDVIDQFDDPAREAGVRIVPCCGLDCIPSDLVTLIGVEHFRRVHGESTAEVRHSIQNINVIPSGGTIHSALNLFNAPLSKILAMTGPMYLVGKDRVRSGASGKDKLVQSLLRYDRDLRQWQSSFIAFEVANANYVRRSHSLLNYGPRFRFLESIRIANPLIPIVALPILAFAATLLYLLRPLRYLITRFVNQGTGADALTLRSQYFVGKAIAVSESGRKAVCTVITPTDPGYIETAKMLSEAALSIVLDGKKLEELSVVGLGVGIKSSGVLTAASGMGMVYVERLRKAGLVLNVSPVP
ncbi:Saccharopine dehydrogenase-domain-containing protein [Cladochytrium replicatum]|nr:Saccharopine dehydrogenase-domain-containing protein [Cladochytrium replicatum]